MLHKLLLTGGLLMASAMSIAALESPYTGSPAPTSGCPDFYLYQVESGRWLQANSRTSGYWTTRAELYTEGLDFGIEYKNGKYIIHTKFNGGKNMYSRNMYMDTGNTTNYDFEPVTVNGVSNAYRIADHNLGDPLQANLKDHYMGSNNGNIVHIPASEIETTAYGKTWQLVSREERIAKMKEEAAAGNPANASWLVPGQAFSNNDERNNQWTLQKGSTQDANLQEDGSPSYNAVRRTLNTNGYLHYITLTDLPNGTYRMNLYGAYRPIDLGGGTSQEVKDKLAANEYEVKAKYFAGASNVPMKSIADFQQTTDGGGYYKLKDNCWVPNGSGTFVRVLSQRKCLNDWIETVVTDGTLILGISHIPAGESGNMIFYDDIQLQYVSENTVPSAELKAAMTAELNEAIAGYESLAGIGAFDNLVAKAKDGIENNPTAFRRAIMDLPGIINAFAGNDANTFKAILALAKEEGVDTKAHEAAFNNAANAAAVTSAIKDLRWARRRAAAFRHVDNFIGSKPAEGKFYLFNVGQRQFLNQGSDWATHANVNYHGLYCTLEAAENGEYFINTNVIANETYLNHGGYTDCAKDAFAFKAAENGAYYITYEADGQTKYLAYDPYAPTDGGYGDETTVSAKAENMEGNADAMWKLVSKEERMELLQNASAESPADVTFMIENPGFDKKLSDDAWNRANISIVPDGGNNFNDRIIDVYDADNLSISQEIAGLPAGIYTVMVQACYRHCGSTDQFNNEYKDAAYLYGTEISPVAVQSEGVEMPSYAETPIMNIFAESNKAPGEGTTYTDNDGNVMERPNSTEQAINYFHTGLYAANAATFEKKSADSNVEVGLYKEQKHYSGDMVQADNFRLLYMGKNDTSSVIDQIAADNNSDARIFNLQGIEVKTPVRGAIYIQNGKKFIVK